MSPGEVLDALEGVVRQLYATPDSPVVAAVLVPEGILLIARDTSHVLIQTQAARLEVVT